MTTPFKTVSQTAGFVPAGPLQDELKDRLDQSQFKDAYSHMGIALADLTNIGEDPEPTGPFSVPFAASNSEREMPIYSLAKIHPMLAAFRLRERVTVAVAAIGAAATSVNEVVEKITADWKTLVTRAISKPPNDFPNLNHIFDFQNQSPWKPSFKDGNNDLSALRAHHEKPTAATLPFMDRLKLMIRFSDNLAAGSCVRDIGFQYMNKTLAEEGFADNTRNGILWLGGDYGFTTQPPIMGPPPWDPGKGATWVRANAKGIASYLVLAWTNRLVDKDSSREMRGILRERPGALTTDIAMRTPSKVRAFSKVGLNGTRSEGVIMESNTASGLIRYAGVGLNGRNDGQVFPELAVIFRDSVAALH